VNESPNLRAALTRRPIFVEQPYLLPSTCIIATINAQFRTAEREFRMAPEPSKKVMAERRPLVDLFELNAIEQQQLCFWLYQAAEQNQLDRYCNTAFLIHLGGFGDVTRIVPDMAEAIRRKVEPACHRLTTHRSGDDLFLHGGDLATLYYYKQIFPDLFTKIWHDFLTDKPENEVMAHINEELRALLHYCEQNHYLTAWLSSAVHMVSVWPKTFVPPQLSAASTLTLLRAVLWELWREAHNHQQQNNCRQGAVNFRLYGCAEHDDPLVQDMLCWGTAISHPDDPISLNEEDRDTFISNTTYRLILQAPNLHLDHNGLICIE